MRVRKAVSQGYLTNINLKSDPNPLAYGATSTRNTLSSKIVFQDAAVQDRAGEEYQDPFDSMPSSQESTSTIVSDTTSTLGARSKKRELEAEAEDYHALFFRDEDEMEATSTHLRPMAQPKSRRKLQTGDAVPSIKESLFPSMEPDDFGEADFLNPANGKWREDSDVS